MAMDVVDYTIFGSSMQFVEIELDPEEAAVGEPGAMMYMENDIVMDTVFGDGSPQQQGFMNKLMGAGRRLLTGESMFTTIFSNQGQGKRRVAFAAPYPGTILPVHLPDVGGTLICQKDAFLCAAKGVSMGMAFQKRMGTGLFGGEGFILQRLEGDGLVFVHASGTLYERALQPGEELLVDTGCLAAIQNTVDYDIRYVGKVKSALFSGEGLFFASLKGPGKVWLQSLPFSRLAGRILSAAGPGGGREEGSVLGALGGLLDGDNG
jgi:uncharacterized protein (TIGR00266 family)